MHIYLYDIYEQKASRLVLAIKIATILYDLQYHSPNSPSERAKAWKITITPISLCILNVRLAKIIDQYGRLDFANADLVNGREERISIFLIARLQHFEHLSCRFGTLQFLTA